MIAKSFALFTAWSLKMGIRTIAIIFVLTLFSISLKSQLITLNDLREQVPDSIFLKPIGVDRIDTILNDSTQRAKTILFYVGGKLGQRQEYYPDGRLNEICRYNSIGEMLWYFSWYSNGQVFQANYYKGGCMDHGTIWFPDGKLQEEAVPHNDTCVRVFYYETGQIGRIEKTHDCVRFDDVYFCENGRKIAEDSLGKEYVFRKYYCDGNLKIECRKNVKGYLIGEYTYFNSNGKIAIKGRFKEEAISYLTVIEGGLGQRDGKWKYYDEAGHLNKIEIYKNGKLQKVAKLLTGIAKFFSRK